MKVMSCNGIPSSYVPRKRFEFTIGQPEQLSSYRLEGKSTTHHFCTNCGSNIIVQNEEAGEVVVNVRAVDGVEVSKLRLTNLDGRNKL